jgi:protein-S-isoprenylcysteine O-methyltransferase Ste14
MGDLFEVEPALRIVLGAGWAVHLLSWIGALRRVGLGAAERKEWPRETLLRLAMVALLVHALLAPGLLSPVLGPFTGPFAVLVFWGGHLLAVKARLELGGAWGIGTEPRPAGEVVERGLYGFVRHPIYMGTFAALVSQLVLLRNVSSLVLVVGAVLVIPWKISRENASLRARI